MRITVKIESSLRPESRRLIAGSEAALRAVYPPEECFSLSAEELAAPNAEFLVARADGKAVGCVALVDRGSYGEVKRLYVDPEARGLGIARMLMAGLESAAADIGLTRLKLETGEALEAATALYRRSGFRDCLPFGGYSGAPSSLFMEKSLSSFEEFNPGRTAWHA